MSAHNDVAPDTLGVELTEDGIAVEYNDSRTVFYHGVPKKADGKLRTAPAKDAHDGRHRRLGDPGILVYVNDLNTHDDILEDTGVGRIMLDDEGGRTVPRRRRARPPDARRSRSGPGPGGRARLRLRRGRDGRTELRIVSPES